MPKEEKHLLNEEPKKLLGMPREKLYLAADNKSGPNMNLEGLLLIKGLRKEEVYTSGTAAATRYLEKRIHRRMRSWLSSYINRSYLKNESRHKVNGQKAWLGAVLWDRLSINGQLRAILGDLLIKEIKKIRNNEHKKNNHENGFDVCLAIKKIRSMSAVELRDLLFDLQTRSKENQSIFCKYLSNGYRQDIEKILLFFGEYPKEKANKFVMDFWNNYFSQSRNEIKKVESALKADNCFIISDKPTRSEQTPDQTQNVKNLTGHNNNYVARFQTRFIDIRLGLSSDLRIRKNIKKLIRIKKRNYVLICFIGITLFSAFSRVWVREPKTVYGILQTKGILEAYSYLMANKNEGFSYAYELAWIRFRKGDFEESKKTIYRLLSSDLTSLYKADCLYLLGSIERSLGNYENAIGVLIDAETTYSEFEYYGDLYQATLERANAYLDIQEPQKARDLLSLARNIYFKSDRSVSFDRWHAISFRLELVSGELKKAFDHAVERFTYISDKQNGKLSDANSDLGLIYGLLGNLEYAEYHTEVADDYIFYLKDEERKYYNSINNIVIRNCRGYSTQDLIEKIRLWAQKFSKPDLENRLDFALSIKCIQ